MKKINKKHLLLAMFLVTIFIVVMLFCYFNDTIFSNITLKYLYLESGSGSLLERKSRYEQLPVFIQKRLLYCQINNLSSTNELKRRQALFFIYGLCRYFPTWRRYVVIGFDSERNGLLVELRLQILVNGNISYETVISKTTALKYQNYLKVGLKSKYEEARSYAVIGLASAYRNNDMNFQKYIIPFLNDDNEHVRSITYIYTRFWGPKNWQIIFEKKLKEEKSAKVRKLIRYMLNPLSERSRLKWTTEEKDF
jgi:hypothetical protein